jgi:hypothetical protein
LAYLLLLLPLPRLLQGQLAVEVAGAGRHEGV